MINSYGNRLIGKAVSTLQTPKGKKSGNADFCAHFENFLNPPDTTDTWEYTPLHQQYIPILDDAIDVSEVLRCTKKLRPNKAADSDGIPPDVLKLFTFKKGRWDDPDNYRGISIISAIPKLYDMVLSNRFSLWYKPLPEQAGAQTRRSREELILCIRLLIDIAQKSGDTLYIVFIDYQKAYVCVNRL